MVKSSTCFFHMCKAMTSFWTAAKIYFKMHIGASYQLSSAHLSSQLPTVALIDRKECIPFQPEGMAN